MNANNIYWAATIACGLTSAFALGIISLLPASKLLIILTVLMWLIGTLSTAFIIAVTAPDYKTPEL